MKYRLFAGLAIASVFAFVALPAFADQSQGVNLSAGQYLDIHDPYLNVGYTMPIGHGWSLEPNAEYIFVNSGSMFSFNVDGRYLLTPSSPNPMYVGAGFGVIRRNQAVNSTNSAVNLMWGVDFDAYQGPFTPFVRIKSVFANNSDIAVSFGLHFGRHSGGQSKH